MDDLRDKYIGLIAAAGDESALEDLRVQAVGKKGEIQNLATKNILPCLLPVFRLAFLPSFFW